VILDEFLEFSLLQIHTFIICNFYIRVSIVCKKRIMPSVFPYINNTTFSKIKSGKLIDS